jgi:hypothetical protein
MIRVFERRRRAIERGIIEALQLAWLWLRHQPRSALTLWFKDRMERNGIVGARRRSWRWRESCWSRYGNM